MSRIVLFAVAVVFAAPIAEVQAGLFRKRSRTACCEPAPVCCDAGPVVPVPNPNPNPNPNPKPNPNPNPNPKPNPKPTPEPLPKKPVTIDSDAWKPFSNAAGKFTATFPGAPKETVQKINGISNYVYAVESGSAVFAVSYFDLPPNVALTLDTSVSAYAKGVSGTVVTDKKFTINDEYPARDVTISTPKGTHHMLIFFVKNRQYQVIASGPITEKDGQKFLDSFKLK
jgi:hypothetical protein